MISLLKTMLLMVTINNAVHQLSCYKPLLENSLRDEFLSGYNPKVFPAPKSNQKLSVDISVTPSSLESVDIRSSTAKIVAFFMIIWNNHQLVWNDTKFASVESFQDITSSIWVPKIVQYKTAGSFFVKKEREVTVFNDGRCALPVIETLYGQCKSKIEEFPSDVHYCSFSFYLSNVNKDNGNISLAVSYNPQSIINEAWSIQVSATSKLLKGSTVSYSLNLIIRRKPSYLQRKIVAPLIILVVFTVTSHMLPIESGERIGLSMTSILTMMITLQYAMEELPETDKEPTVLYFGRLIMFCMVVSLLLTIAAINLYHRKRSPMSHKMKVVLSVICRVFCVRYERQDQVSDIKADKEGNENEEWVVLANVLDRFSLVSFFCVAVAFAVRIAPWLTF